MATGRYGAHDLLADTPQSLAQGETDRFTACSVSMVNRGNTPCKVSIAITTSANAINDLDYIDKDVEILPACVLERTGIAIKSGQYITVSSNQARVSAVAYGVESGATVSVTEIPDVSSGSIPAQFIATSAVSLLNEYDTRPGPSGSVVVFGNVEAPANPGSTGWSNGQILAYSNTGQFSYGAQIRHSSFNSGEYTARIEAGTTDSSGNAYFGGRNLHATSGSGSIGLVVGKINGAGAPQWNKYMQDGSYSTGGFYELQGIDVSQDDGEVYVSSYTNNAPGNTGSNRQVVIKALDSSDGSAHSNGHVVLARGSATTQSDGGKIACSPSGHLYCAFMTSNATPNGSGSMVTLTKLNPDSAYSEVWSRDSYMVENNGNQGYNIYDISVAPNNDVYMVGGFTSTTPIIVKYDANGVWQWTRSHETGPNVYFGNFTISAHSAGVVLNCKISDGTYEGYAANFDTSGAVTWQYRFDNDYELNHPTVIGDSVYSTDDDSRVHKVPLSGLTTPQTIPGSTVISTGTVTWSNPGTNANTNIQPVRSFTDSATATLIRDTSYSGPATFTDANTSYWNVTSIASGSNTVTLLS
tara:strand:- start:607 stop:2355 length:1749 start_codon:yes stop_codon:yes gene_type:complete